MDSVLIVSCSEKGTETLTELLNAAGFHQIAAIRSCGEARRLLLERDFDLMIINAPLRDESGESFSRQVALNGALQVILVVKSEYFDAVSAICEDDGVLTISKPVNKAVFWSALKLAGAAQSRLRRAQAENAKLKQKIEDIRIVDRAKCLLISYMNMGEKEAHRFIEKQAMDMRFTKREVAEGILKTYET
ncbi:MAG: ANTAR domain-containing protein [Oscillospiraceae bacterium]|nr:ANTAR domain-containing protein [Oscillospiraceae bacterium]